MYGLQEHTTLGNRNILNFDVEVGTFVYDYARLAGLGDLECLLLVVGHGV
jgi:hypothetical protein